MIENYSTQITPSTTKDWTDKTVEERIKLLRNELKKINCMRILNR